MQRNIRAKQNFRPSKPMVNVDQTSVEHYKIPSNQVQIHFVNSADQFNRLFDRLFRNEDLCLGFDCMFHILQANEKYPTFL